MTNVECPLCRIKMDIEFDYDYELGFFWCDDCRERVQQYWKPKD